MATSLKICGVKTPETLAAVVAAGAEYFGLVFFAKSPRNIDFGAAAALAGIGRTAGGVKSVALLVDPDDALVDRVLSDVQPDYLQVHGKETIERVGAIRRRSGRPLIKAVSVATRDDVDAALAFYQPGVLADMLLFDAKPTSGAELPGGNGLAFDWQILDGVASRMPFMLAGGLTPKNVAAAIRRTGCAIADTSSGVESAPGVKDAALIAAFVRAARGG
jgi:phosphoribosylanthranilate isomerase